MPGRILRLLTPSFAGQIQRYLKRHGCLNGWRRVDGALRRSIKFPTFLDGIEAVRRVADRAEEKDHHPDIDIRWRTVTFALVTHSAGGITKNDIAMARDINGIVGG